MQSSDAPRSPPISSPSEFPGGMTTSAFRANDRNEGNGNNKRGTRGGAGYVRIPSLRMRRVRGSLERGSPSCHEYSNWLRPLDDQEEEEGFLITIKCHLRVRIFLLAIVVIGHDSHACLPSSTFDLLPSLSLPHLELRPFFVLVSYNNSSSASPLSYLFFLFLSSPLTPATSRKREKGAHGRAVFPVTRKMRLRDATMVFERSIGRFPRSSHYDVPIQQSCCFLLRFFFFFFFLLISRSRIRNCASASGRTIVLRFLGLTRSCIYAYMHMQERLFGCRDGKYSRLQRRTKSTDFDDLVDLDRSEVLVWRDLCYGSLSRNLIYEIFLNDF